MIAKGNLHGNGTKLARYLMTGEKGESAELIETRGLEGFGGDPETAFAVLQQIADSQTNSTRPFFHSQTRLAPGEQLTKEQWLEVADRQEKRLGFVGQPRVASFHTSPETGEKHLHVAWFRIDLETMRAIDPGMFKNHLKELSRTLEKEFALREVSNQRAPDDKTRAPDRKEFEEARRLKTDLKAIRNTILDCWQQSDNGRALSAALGANELMLANGDRRDCFVVVDLAGGQHALNKKLTGLTLAETRARLADLDRAQLPSVEQAQETQHARQSQIDAERHPAPQPETHFDRDAANAEWMNAVEAAAIAQEQAGEIIPQKAPQQIEPGRDTDQDRPAARGRYAPLQPPEPAPQARPEAALSSTPAEIRLAWSLSNTASELEDALSVRGMSLAHVAAAEAEASREAAELHAERKQAQEQTKDATAQGRYAELKPPEPGRYTSPLKEGEIVVIDPRGSVYRLTQRVTGDDRAEIAGRLAGVDRDALMNVADTRETMQAAAHAAWKAERQVEREAARPASWIENRIAQCAERAATSGAIIQRDAEGNRVTGAEALADRLRPEDERITEGALVRGAEAFFARLDDAGIVIVRVTEADIRALSALRQTETAAQETIISARVPHHYAEVLPGDLAAVNRDGDIFRINAAKLGQAAQYLGADLPGVVEARAAFEIEREKTGEVWAGKRAETAADRETFAADQAEYLDEVHAMRGVRETTHDAANTVDTGISTGRKVLGAVAKAFETGFSLVFGWAVAAPKLSPQQMRDQAKADGNLETLHARAAAAAENERETSQDELIWQQNKQQQEADRSFAALYGTPPTMQERNTGRGRDDDYERGRER